jgi:hypothetical protein
VIIFGERHLLSLLRCYQNHYNECRTHLSLDKDAALSRAVQVSGSISSTLFLADYTINICRV